MVHFKGIQVNLVAQDFHLRECHFNLVTFFTPLDIFKIIPCLDHKIVAINIFTLSKWYFDSEQLSPVIGHIYFCAICGLCRQFPNIFKSYFRSLALRCDYTAQSNCPKCDYQNHCKNDNYIFCKMLSYKFQHPSLFCTFLFLILHTHFLSTVYKFAYSHYSIPIKNKHTKTVISKKIKITVSMHSLCCMPITALAG